MKARSPFAQKDVMRGGAKGLEAVNGKDQFKRGVRFGKQRRLHAIRSGTRPGGLAIFETIERVVGPGSGMKKVGTGKNDRGLPALPEPPPPEALRTPFSVYSSRKLQD